MAEMCVGIDEYEYCSSGEVLILAILVECLFYLFVFIGGWEMLRRWRIKKAEQRRLKAEEWHPIGYQKK